MTNRKTDTRLHRMRHKLRTWLEQPDQKRTWRGRVAIHQVRLWHAAFRQLARDQLITVAGDLTFKTLLSLVPILVMVLVVLDMFAGAQVGQRVLDGLFEALHIDALQITAGGEEVDAAARINQLVEEARARVNAAAVVGIVFLFILAINMLSTMEAAMNRIWKVAHRRAFWRKILMFWMVLTMGPLLGALAVHLSGWLAGTTSDAPGWLMTMGRFAVELVAVWAVLMLVFSVLPYTRVQPRAALVGAVVAGTLWHLVAKSAFALYLDHAVNYQQVFGSIAVVPLFFLWIYITWVFVLFGCELAYAVQHLDRLAPGGETGPREYGVRTQLAVISAAAICAKRYLRGEGPSSPHRLARAAGADVNELAPVLARLAEAGLLARTGSEEDGEQGYLPARPPALIPLSEIVQTLEGGKQPDDTNQALQRRVAGLLGAGEAEDKLAETTLAAVAENA